MHRENGSVQDQSGRVISGHDYSSRQFPLKVTLSCSYIPALADQCSCDECSFCPVTQNK